MLLLHIGFLYVDHSSMLYCQNNHSIEIFICRKSNELLHFYFFRNAWTHMSSSRYECQSLISIVTVFFFIPSSHFFLLQLSLATIKFVISNWITVEGQHADLVYFFIVIESPPLLSWHINKWDCIKRCNMSHMIYYGLHNIIYGLYSFLLLGPWISAWFYCFTS